jgi:AcrR family transcriptional regulator
MNHDSGLRAQNKIATRRRILRAADKLFHEQGFAATTLERIATRAGVHKQTVLRYFGSKDEIALEFRRAALHQFREGLLDPARRVSVMKYWRDFIESSARAVTERGDMLRYNKLVESEPALMAASLKIFMQYEELLTEALSREAGTNADRDIYARLHAAFLVNGNFTIARMLLNSGSLEKYVEIAGLVIDFTAKCFPSRAEFATFEARHRRKGRVARRTVTE